MKIVRQSATELVLEDSSLWISVLLAIASLPLFYASLRAGRHGNFFTAGFFLLCSLLWLRKSTFTFDATERMVRWRRLRFFQIVSGSLPFAQIAGVRIETSAGRPGAPHTYRLILLTASKSIPLTDAYSKGRDRHIALRTSLQAFLAGDSGLVDSFPATSADLDSSLRSLLLQGRTIDAIRLLRSSENIDLIVAAERVEALASQMKLRS